MGRKKQEQEQKPQADQPVAVVAAATQEIADQTVQQAHRRLSAMRTLSERLGVEASAMFMASLRNVAFNSPDVSEEQLMALVVVANQYKLNPFTRELYAFPGRGGSIVPIVSVDGWFRIINEHPMNDGIEYAEIYDQDRSLIAGEVTIHRKDRQFPTVIREYLSEVRRDTDPWRQHQRRMLRHKTIIQGGRVAFGFAGIYEPDEGERVLEAQRFQQPARAGGEGVRAALEQQPPAANGGGKKPVAAVEPKPCAFVGAGGEPCTLLDGHDGVHRAAAPQPDADDDGQERLPV